MTERPKAPPASLPTLDDIRACFVLPPERRRPEWLLNLPPDFLLADCLYVIRMSRAAPRELIYGRERYKLAGAIRTIRSVAPTLIREAEEFAADAKRQGLPTSMDRFAELTADLLAATQPLEHVTQRIDERGDWHGWARYFAMLIRHIADRMQPRVTFNPDHPMNRKRPRVSFSKETSAGLIILKELLHLAGFDDVSETQIIEWARGRKKAGK